MYVGKQHSEETRLKIAAKTKEAMLRRKMEKANGKYEYRYIDRCT
jgi:hypothetical protein